MNIVSRLEAALASFEHYLGADLTAEDVQLVRSVKVALAGIEGGTMLPRHHVLQTIRVFVGELEQTTMAAEYVDMGRNAYADLCRLWGTRLVEGPLYVHAPMPRDDEARHYDSQGYCDNPARGY